MGAVGLWDEASLTFGSENQNWTNTILKTQGEWGGCSYEAKGCDWVMQIDSGPGCSIDPSYNHGKWPSLYAMVT